MDFIEADMRTKLDEMKREAGRAVRWSLDNGRLCRL